MNTANNETATVEPRSRKQYNKLNIMQMHKVGEVFSKHTKNKGTPSARLDVTDVEMARILSHEIGRPVSSTSITWYRRPNNFNLKSCKRTKSILWKGKEKKEVKVKRAYHRRSNVDAGMSSVQVLIMNTAKIYKLLGRIAEKLHA